MRFYRKLSCQISSKQSAILPAVLLVGAVFMQAFPPVCVASEPNSSTLQYSLKDPRGKTVSALIRVAMQPESILKEKDRVSRADFEVFKNTQLGLIKSPLVLLSALRKKNIAGLEMVKRQKDPMSWLENKLKAGYVNNSEIMRVSLTSDNPKEAADLVNAVVDAYIDEVVNKEERRRRETLSQLTQIYNSKEEEVRRKKAHFIELSKQLNAGNGKAMKTQATVNIRELYDLRAALIRLQMDLGKAQAALKTSQAMLSRFDKAPTLELELEKLISNDPICKELLKQIANLLAAISKQEQADMSGDNKAEVERLTKQLESMEKELSIRENELYNLIKHANRAKIEEKIAAAEVQVKILNKQFNEMAAKIEVHEKKVIDLGEICVDIEMMSSEITILEKVLAEIAVKRERYLIESRTRPRITLESAAHPQKK